MSNQKSEVMICSGSLLGELASSRMGEEVSLRDTHLLLLLGPTVDGRRSRFGVGGSGELDRGRHLVNFLYSLVGNWVSQCLDTLAGGGEF